MRHHVRRSSLHLFRHRHRRRRRRRTGDGDLHASTRVGQHRADRRCATSWRQILVSGGGRCNVTNARVTERDFNGGSAAAIRQILRTLPVSRTIALFTELGVPLHEEEHGKLFPDSNRARDVLDALLGEARRLGVERIDGCRVAAVHSSPAGFAIDTSLGVLRARRVVLATGGQSLPKSGSDGSGWIMARRLGHTIVPPVPALVPLTLSASALSHAALSGIAHDVEIAVWIDGRIGTRVSGSLLWTHFGISGPAALDVSRHWTRGVAEHRTVALTLNVVPDHTFDTVDSALVAASADRARATLATILSVWMPGAVADAFLAAVDIPRSQAVGSLTRDARRRLAHALVEWPLAVSGTRGYNYAEVTAGGVDLAEVDPKTMESRVQRGLYLVGEVLDVDGRLGGFNFQWAWASAATAARGLTRT
ncbi:MAG: NAD(P)/FAD-dependent oxidoreductase [Chitinophagaceae bacterium]